MRDRATAVLLAALAATPAAAEHDPFVRGFDAVPVKPAVLPAGFITLDGAELWPARSFRAALLFDVIAGVLGLRIGGESAGALIPGRVDAHVLGAFAPHPRADVGFDVPVTLFQADGFSRLGALGFPQTGVLAASLSDARVVGRVGLLAPGERPVGLAAALELRLPTGDAMSFTGNGTVLVAPRLAAERRVGPVRLAANLGFRLRAGHGQYLNLYVGNELTFGLAAHYGAGSIGPAHDVALLAEVVGATSTVAPFTLARADVFKTPVEVFLGVRARLLGRWSIEVAVASSLTPPAAGGYGREAFRVVAGLRYAAVHNDRDGDGVADDVDRCQREPGPSDLDGCPDRDDDDVADLEDRCPDAAGPPDNDGCPQTDPPLVVVETTRLRLKANVRFATGSDVLLVQSHRLLDEVAKVLNEHPEIGRVRIEGHTDDRGSRVYNLDLSSRRARSVLEYLTGRGVDPGRLEARGSAFDRPIAPNATPLGRARNRRVEFRIVPAGEQGDVPSPR